MIEIARGTLSQGFHGGSRGVSPGFCGSGELFVSFIYPMGIRWFSEFRVPMDAQTTMGPDSHPPEIR